ncbi:MAG TPA: SDR family NAD(P)-dependent oxidoreductase [Hypericibacter adhaerens]|jgi:NAD(P)-dependent dehydrogenase (short-subunit alcohol dehydrogenase family)|uniref:SDR family oxidoreductase n=1 Tax=Hypericibacter adhaerens TaxID=2602016 RepID=A0A5J6MZZ0_9PROT|nr:SDR family NAD(P)-dependent oxidoreductase [Hypericibacter adhaerens]QEX22554.1 SDR family oxidoreductase [Hypericibacter adhaerens]HWA44349.1 SDR family NAD(P)-dependent oxidoreductase [Hypericibacter adhaerens]
MAKTERALIVGVGAGLSASLARRLRHDGAEVALASRNIDKLAGLVKESGARAYRCDARRREDVAALFKAVDQELGGLDLVIYNPSQRARGPFVDLDPTEVEQTLMVTAYGGFLVAQEAARRMLKQGHGSILFTGASASVKGYAQSAPFAMGKFALRGLAQSMARELAPKNIHVAHFVIDGSIGKDPEGEARLDPDAIADTYLHIHRQPRSAWTWEVELRPWVERF